MTTDGLPPNPKVGQVGTSSDQRMFRWHADEWRRIGVTAPTKTDLRALRQMLLGRRA